MKVIAFIHSLEDKATCTHHSDEAEILEKTGDNSYIAEYRGKKCTAVFNPFVCSYFVDDVYGVLS